MNNKFNLLNKICILSLCCLIWSTNKSMELDNTAIVLSSSAPTSYDKASFLNKFSEMFSSITPITMVRKYFTKNTIQIMNNIVDKQREISEKDTKKFVKLYERCLRYGTGAHVDSKEYKELFNLSKKILVYIHPDKELLDNEIATSITKQINTLRDYSLQETGATLPTPPPPTYISTLCMQTLFTGTMHYGFNLGHELGKRLALKLFGDYELSEKDKSILKQNNIQNKIFHRAVNNFIIAQKLRKFSEKSTNP